MAGEMSGGMRLAAYLAALCLCCGLAQLTLSSSSSPSVLGQRTATVAGKQRLVKLDDGADSKPEEEDEEDPLPSEVAWHEKYTKDFGIPRGLGYYHIHHGRKFIRSHSAESGSSETSRPRPIDRGWQPEYSREPWVPFKKDEDVIPKGIGYYSGNKRWVHPKSTRIDYDEAETKDEHDIIPRGLGFYRATSGKEYKEDHLRDPTYYYQAHRLAYPNLPDAGNHAQFVPDDERV